MFFLAVRLGMGLDMAGASKGEVGSAFGCKMDQQWSCHMSSTCTLAAHLLWHVLEVFVLKVSLHAPNQALREELVPAAKAFAAQPRISKWLVDLMMIWWHSFVFVLKRLTLVCFRDFVSETILMSFQSSQAAWDHWAWRNRGIRAQKAQVIWLSCRDCLFAACIFSSCLRGCACNIYLYVYIMYTYIFFFFQISLLIDVCWDLRFLTLYWKMLVNLVSNL